MVPKLPSISGLPDFNQNNNTKISTNSNDDDGSFISAISDYSNDRKQQYIHTDSMLIYFGQLEYVKKNIPSEKPRESSKNLFNIKNQRFRYLYQSIQKILLSVVNMFVPGPSPAVLLMNYVLIF